MRGGRPLVSVGLPTYERAAALEVAARSVLRQTHEDLELVISDNASGEETSRLTGELAAEDPRVRTVRHRTNRGMTANFNAALAECRGDFVMLLGDDDSIAPDYVARCLETLRSDPGLALVAGAPRYAAEAVPVVQPRSLNLLDDDPARRVARYFAEVTDNSVFFGLTRRAVRDRVPPMRNCVGADWLTVASIVVQGRVRTLADTHVFRSHLGASRDVATLGAELRVPPREAHSPYLHLARHVAAEIVWRSPALRSLPVRSRVRLAWECIGRPLRLHETPGHFPPSRLSRAMLHLRGER
jgi:glycosyltransferase involved in cell wall biosynthesis